MTGIKACLHIFAVSALFILLFASVASCGSGSPAGDGVLSGTVRRGPVSPAVRPGEPSSRPASGVTVVITSAGGKKTASAVTDARGRYSVSLPPGSYAVDIVRTPSAFSKDLPASVTVHSGKKTSLDILLDTGIR